MMKIIRHILDYRHYQKYFSKFILP